jgi:hypothetical protein
MATITPTSQVNAATMAANWSKGVAANSGKWLAKYLAPKALFNANPAASQAAWSAGIQTALANNSYATGMANANVAVAASNAQNFGQTNYANSGTNKAYKYTNKSASLAAAITAVSQQVQAMPRGKGANNNNRMLAWSQGMAAYKGKITAS